MKSPALFALATIVFASCEDTTQPQATAAIQSPQFAIVSVPGNFSTIQAAHDAASSGDTILVAPGTYVGQITITKAITLASHFLTTGDSSFIATTILDGGGAAFVIEIPSGAEDGSVIQGFTIQNADDGITPRAHFNLLNCLVRNTSDGVDYEDGSGGLVQFCTFEFNSDDGLDLDNDVDLVIADNVIRNNNDDGIEIRMQSYSGPTLNITIVRNEIYGNGEDGIQLIHYDVLTDRFFEITYNYIYDNADAGIGMMDGATTNEDFRAADIPETIYIFNNTFANNSHGITGGDNTVVLNNIFIDHPVIAVKNVDAGSELAFNLFFNNGTDNSGSNVDVGSSVFADPLLTADLELPAGSPAIDAGTALYVWQGITVLDLPTSGYSGAAPDIGAFEFASGSGAPPDPPVLASPLDEAVDVGLTPTLTWNGEGDSFTVQIASDGAFGNIVDAALVSTTQYTVAVGALDHATLYFWRVNASNANGTSDFSAVWSFTTAAATAPPDAPILVSPADGAVDVPVEATLEWSGTADHFDVEVATDPGFTSVVFSTNTVSTTTTLPPGTLLNDTDYYWRVRGNNSFGPGDFSTAFVFTTVALPDTEPPSQPQNLTSPARTSTTIDLLWDASTDNVGVSSYNIYRDDVLVASESSTNHTAVGLTPETSYNLQVSAVDAAGNESVLSATLVATTDPIPQPAIHVGGIALQLRSQGRRNSGRAVIAIVDKSGNPVDNANVVVQWSGLTTAVDAAITSGGDVRFDSDKVSNSQSGQFVITVTDVTLSGFVYDLASNVATAACVDTTGSACPVGPPDTEPPAAPASLTATAGPGSVSLDWADNTEPDWASYSVYRSTTSGGDPVLIVEGLTSSLYTDTGLNAGTTYYYVVTAKDTSGNESGPSNEASATPTEPPQLSIHVGDISVAIVKQGRNYRGRATVSVLDRDGNPASGVEVEGSWTWNSTDIGAGSGVTDGNGVATVNSSKKKASSGDVFTFTVTNLILNGSSYDSASNVTTSDSATVQ